MRKCLVAVSVMLLLVGAAPFGEPAPTKYSLVSVNGGETLHVYRDGNKAVVDLYMPKGAHHPAIHTRSIIDVPSTENRTWNLLDPKTQCDGMGKGDWPDPFAAWKRSLDSFPGKLKKVGKGKVAGMAATVFESTAPQGSAKLWRDDRYGLLLKLVVKPKGRKAMPLVLVRSFKVGRPNPKELEVPARCKWNH